MAVIEKVKLQNNTALVSCIWLLVLYLKLWKWGIYGQHNMRQTLNQILKLNCISDCILTSPVVPSFTRHPQMSDERDGLSIGAIHGLIIDFVAFVVSNFNLETNGFCQKF